MSGDDTWNSAYITCKAPLKFPATPVENTSSVDARDTMHENTLDHWFCKTQASKPLACQQALSQHKPQIHSKLKWARIHILSTTVIHGTLLLVHIDIYNVP
jgi:hypothetical protein